MRQLLQSLRDGSISHVEVPNPVPGPQDVVVATRASLISAGTERMLLEFGRGNWLQRVRTQPDKLHQVLEKLRTDGAVATFQSVRAKLDAPLPLGYCQAGVVTAVGDAVKEFAVGDRVATNGPHADVVRVSRRLAVRIPPEVSFEAAAFAPLGAIALHGLRLAQPTLGETIVVYGLGLVGLLTVQLVRANGCRAIGIDTDGSRLALAQRLGAEVVDGNGDGVAERVRELTAGLGADAVALTLASSSDEPVTHAAQMCRKRGRLVLIGTTGLSLRRDVLYRNELSFTVSCSYGPGRYDPVYEVEGRDYPVPYVRWTEQRNFEAVLDVMATGRLDVTALVTHRFGFDVAAKAYDILLGPTPCLGVVLEYPNSGETSSAPAHGIVLRAPASPLRRRARIAVVGAGAFAVRTLIPTLRRCGADLYGITSAGATSAAAAGRRFGFERVTADWEPLVEHPAVDGVVIATRHDSHARIAAAALAAGKHVFVEKPLALVEEDVDHIEELLRQGDRVLVVGFNRRFAPLTGPIVSQLTKRAGPIAVVYTMNAGFVSSDHWTQDPTVGGGRIVGEACHMLDFARCLVGAPIRTLGAVASRDRRGRPIADIAHLSVGFTDGSSAALSYLANGSRRYPKERVDVFWEGRTVTIDNWRRARTFGAPGVGGRLRWGQDKGHVHLVKAWLRAVERGGQGPIPVNELLEVSRWAIRAEAVVRGDHAPVQ